jgi:cysteine desulfurase
VTAYLDHAATSPLRPEALEAMMPFFTTEFGNPSGAHAVSRRARKAVDEARERVASCLGCKPFDVVFTGGGTEADNMAVLDHAGGTAVCTAIEHHAVLHPVEAAKGRVAPVRTDGVVDLDALAEALDEDVTVVSVMLANNEVGVIQPLDAVAECVRSRAPKARLHTDAVQAALWLDVSSLTAAADLVSISAHKFGGPKGVGALVVRGGTRLAPRTLGGGQERDLRSGTHNVAGIVGLAAALQATVDRRPDLNARVAPLRNRLADDLAKRLGGVVETGARSQKVAGSCHLRFEGVESEALLFLLDEGGVSASAASACASGAQAASHVLAAMDVSAEDARGSVRFSLGWTTTEAEIDHAVEVTVEAVNRLRDR